MELQRAESRGLSLVHSHGLYTPWPRNGTMQDAAFAEARRLMEDSHASSTRDQYARGWALFVNWVADNYPEHSCLPAKPGLIGLYIGTLRIQKLTKATILHRLAGIAYAHVQARESSPLEHPDLKAQIRGLRRQAERPKQASALVREEATYMLERWSTANSLAEARDRAIFTLAWCTALRRSNIATLMVEDVKFLTDERDGINYLEVFIVRSKTDQEAKGRYIIVTEIGNDPICAYTAVKAWLELAKLKDGPLFRTFTLHPTPSKRMMTANAIDGRDVARTVKRLAVSAGIDPKKFAAHSLRRGFVSSADAVGVRRSLIREQGGWKDDRMLSVYTKVESVRDNALRDMIAKTRKRR